MNHTFNIDVCFKKVPIKEYEWDSISFISGIKLMRVSTKCIEDLLTYESIVESDKKVLLISDCKTSLVIKLNDEGKVIRRSFLSFKKDEEVCEEACNMRATNLKYKLENERLNYSLLLEEDIKMKEFLVKSINSIKDEDKFKYLYYLYFDDVNNYSKEKLIKSIKSDDSEKCQTLYDFLMKN